jgi:hypothetical protein
MNADCLSTKGSIMIIIPQGKLPGITQVLQQEYGAEGISGDQIYEFLRSIFSANIDLY